MFPPLPFAAIPQSYSVTMTPADTPLLGVGMAVSFLCEADSSDPSYEDQNVEVVYGWEFVAEGAGEGVAVVGDGSRVVVEGTSLSITSLEVGDNGMFVCVASNPLVTSVLTSVMLTVEGKYTH